MARLLPYSAVMAALLCAPNSLLASDIFVDAASVNCSTGTGTASLPFCSISEAIAVAVPGDSIVVSPGTYFERIDVGFDLDLIGVAGAGLTTISGAGTSSLQSVVTIQSGANVTMDGLTITDGNAAGGGGIRLGGALVLTASVVSQNVADQGAAIMCTPGADLTVDGCMFESNLVIFAQGGAIRAVASSCVISNSTFRGNRATGGGAISFAGSNPVSHVLELTNCAFENNLVTNSIVGGQGGGVSHAGGRLTVSGSTFEGNTASSGMGGGLFVGDGSQFTIANSTFHDNSAAGNPLSPGSGGGIHLRLGAAGSISNTTITGNSAQSGPDGTGGGLWTDPSTQVVTIRNSILALNSAAPLSSDSGNDVFGAIVSLGHNLIGRGGTGFTNGVLGDLVGSLANPLDPLLGPLQDNGGPTKTRDLYPGSPALDAGDSATFEPLDQRGVSRPVGAVPDIGAVENNMVDFCNGDGGEIPGLCTPCPCGNTAPLGEIGGCLNSAGTSGRLLRSGSSSVAAADLRFEAQGLPASAPAILLSGAKLAPANLANSCFGLGSGIQSSNLDGLRCIVQSVLRHAVRPSDANGTIGVTTSGWGTPNSFFNLSAFTAGQTRYFQATYRDNPTAVCQTGLNTTQASSVTFVP